MFDNWEQDVTAVEERYAEQDPAVVAEELVPAAASVGQAYAGVTGEAWDQPGLRSYGSRFTVASINRYHRNDAVHHRVDVRHAD